MPSSERHGRDKGTQISEYSFGGKMLWKEILCEKYLRKTRMRCLDGEMIGT